MIFTKITSKNLLTKEFSLRDRELVKHTHGNMSKGKYETIDIKFNQLDSFLNDLNQNQAILLGIGATESGKIGASDYLQMGEITRSKSNFGFSDDSMIVFDIDNNMSAEEAIGELVKLDYRLASSEMLVRYGTSSFIYNGDTELQGSTSLHIYVPVNNIENLEDYVTSLKHKSWEIGTAFIKISSSGQMLERYVFDAAVFSPERLVFEAGALCHDGLSQRKPESIYRAGNKLDLVSLGCNTGIAEKNRTEAKKSMIEEATAVKKEWAVKYKEDRILNNISPSMVKNELQSLDNGILAWSHPLHVVDESLDIAEIRAGDVWIHKYNGIKIQDPLEPNGEQKAMLFYNDGNPTVFSFKTGSFKIQRLPSSELKKIEKERKKEDRLNQWITDGFVDFLGDKILPTTENLKALLDISKIGYKYDVILGRHEFTNEAFNINGPQYENKVYYTIRDNAYKAGISPAICDNVPALGNEYATNPLMDAIREYHYEYKQTGDNTDYIQEVVDCITHTGDNENDRILNRYLVEKWFLQSLAAWDDQNLNDHNTDRTAFENVLVIQGPQGLYKTTFFKNLLPSGFDKYFKEGAQLDLKNKDSIMQNTKYAMVELGELEATFNKSDIGQLKAFLSDVHDEYRAPFEKTAEKHRRRTSFCASVNDEAFLRDSTGSRRFWIIKADNIDIKRYLKIPKDRLWAQVYDMYISNATFWMDDRTMSDMLSNRHNNFLSYSPAHDVMAAIDDAARLGISPKRLRASHMFDELKIKYTKTDVNTLTQLLTDAGYTYNGSRFYNVPIQTVL